MIASFEVNYRGKFNKGVVVFYFRDKTKMLEFLKFLEGRTQKFKVRGTTQWRRACKEYQKQKPELWKNAKEFIPGLQNRTLVVFWLRNGIFADIMKLTATFNLRMSSGFFRRFGGFCE
ncbi:hypothetical protein HYU17_04125 [Candidatus Woesearchaeota archaeon]|nr:hypothetical protein [Candidatus Woesearchaeota archaeon]